MATLLVLLLFLFPLTLYCTVLAGVNRRTRPLLVSGSWDFMGVVLACSGFIFVVGPFLLLLVYANQTQALLLQRKDEVEGWMYAVWGRWWPFITAYYVLLFLLMGLTLWNRKRSTVIYNLEPALFEAVWKQTMETCNLLWVRSGNQIFMRKSQSNVPVGQTDSQQIALNPLSQESEDWRQSQAVGPSRYQVGLRVDMFPMFCNFSLVWFGQTDILRHEIEAALTKTLATAHTEDNPAAGWLLGTAVGLFGMMLFCVALMFLILSQENQP